MRTSYPTVERLLPALAEPVALIPKPLPASKRLLLVDDDAGLRRFCALVLQRTGYVVETAADGLLGWDAVRADHYDLLITDIEMPRLNGLELASRVRRAGMRLPIVILSGSLDLLEASDAALLGLAEVFQKPISVPELIRVVEYALTQSPEAAVNGAPVAPSRLAMAPSQHAPSHWGLND